MNEHSAQSALSTTCLGLVLAAGLAVPFGGAEAASRGTDRPQRVAQASAPSDSNGGSSTATPAAPPIGADQQPAPPTPTAPAPIIPVTPTPAPQTTASQPSSNPPLDRKTAPNPILPNTTGTRRNTASGGQQNTVDPNQQYYGGTQSTLGAPQGARLPAYGSTQRNSGLSPSDNSQAYGGTTAYGGTQSSLGTPQTTGLQPQQQYGSTSRNGSQPSGGSYGLNPLPGNPSDNTRQPIGGSALTRDQTGSFGGRGGYDARGNYTGTASQTSGYGQPYAPNGRAVGGLLSNNTDATGPLRPYIPLDQGPRGGPTNSGYGIPNGSRGTYMDGNGIQRTR